MARATMKHYVIGGIATYLLFRMLRGSGSDGAAAAGRMTARNPLERDDVEEPKSQVVAQTPNYEIRRYEPRLEATVDVQAPTAEEASNAGFAVLADFIFGNNEARQSVDMTTPVGAQKIAMTTPVSAQKIAMTTPVGQSRQGDAWTISFTMPSEFTAETLPVPKDPRVRIRQMPAQLYAVQRFRGAPDEAEVVAREAALRAELARTGNQVLPQTAIYNRYDPPWVLPVMRRNEIWVPLAGA